MDVDVKKLTFSAFVVFAAAACSSKSSNTVFPENSSQSTSCKEQRIENRFIVTWEDGTISTHEDASSDRFVENFVNPHLQDIAHVEFDKVISVRTQGDLQTQAAIKDSKTWGQTLVEAPQVWAEGIEGQDVLVAVTDQGMDYEHPQIAPRIAVNAKELSGKPGIDDDGNGLVDDVYGWDFSTSTPTPKLGTSLGASHGTHVAGIIAADPTTGEVKGVAPKAKLIASAFLDKNGDGSTSGAIKALNYAADRGAKIINASWGGPGCSLSLQRTMEEISARGVLLVVAAGNEGNDLDQIPDYPAVLQLPTQITVGAIRSDGYLDSYSNTSYHFVHLAAPGTNIYSTILNDSSGYMTGTSMAAPFVSGAAALLWSARPLASAIEIRHAIIAGVDSGPYRVVTQGRLNMRKALEALKKLVDH